jgi:adenylate cyclase
MKKSARPQLRWLLLLIVPAVWCLASALGWLTFLENRTVDWRFRFRGEIDAPVKVVYVDVDSASISEIGGVPWSRQYYSRVCSALLEHAGVKAIGIDVAFSENGVPESIDWKKRVLGNKEFGAYLFNTPPVVLAASYAATVDRGINGEQIFRELPRVSRLKPGEQAAQPELPTLRLSEKDPRQTFSPALAGLIDTIGGGTREVPAFAPTDVRTYFHMAVELARLHFGVSTEGVKISPDHLDLVRDDGTLAARIPLRDRQLIDVNWFSHWESPRNPRVSFSTVYQYQLMLNSGTEEEQKAAKEFFSDPEFNDAIVLIGPVDPFQQDLGVTSFDDVPQPKVGVHGNMIKTIVSGKYLRRLPEFRGLAIWEFVITYAITLLVTALATASGTRGALTKLAAVACLAGYAALTFALFKWNHVVLPFSAPLGAAFTTSFLGVIWQLVEEEKQKSRIKGMFGTYVSPQLVDRMVESGESPQLGGHDDEITAYFSDIQAFSTFSEKLGSGPLVELMNEYLTACTDIVQAEGGTLDKYIGDAVVAMFGAPISLPDHAYRACVASQLVHRKLGELREKWKNEGAKWPEIVWKMQSRIGLNTGVCMIGNMGSRTRFNYTMMGDNVNLAARMESGSKAYGVYTMVSETTKTACEKGGDRVVFRYLDRIVVRGRSVPVPVYEIVGLKEEITASTQECLSIFASGVERYQVQDWDGAAAYFQRSSLIERQIPGVTPGVESNPSLVMIERCAEMSANPPGADWDGVYTMQSK